MNKEREYQKGKGGKRQSILKIEYTPKQQADFSPINSSDILDFTRNLEKSNNRSQDHWLQISKAQTFPCILGASK